MYLDPNLSMLLLVLETAHLYLYNLKEKLNILQDLSIHHLLVQTNPSLDAQSTRYEVKNVRSASLRADGRVILILEDGCCYMYDYIHWKTWMKISLTDPEMIPTIDPNPSRGNILAVLQANKKKIQTGLGDIDRLNALVEPLVNKRSTVDTGSLRIFKILSQIEHQIACAEILQSEKEWISWNIIYIKRIVDAVEDIHHARIAEAESSMTLISIDKRLHEWAINICQRTCAGFEVSIYSKIHPQSIKKLQDTAVRQTLYQECLSLLDRSAHLQTIANRLNNYSYQDLA